jgi:hypothetical protein
MAGMILGVTVLDEVAPRRPEIASAAPRKLTLTIERPERQRSVVWIRVDRRSRALAFSAGLVARTAARASEGRALWNHSGEPARRADRTALARHGTRCLLRRRAQLERHRSDTGADDHVLAMGCGGDEAEALLDLWATLGDHDESPRRIAEVAEATKRTGKPGPW